MNMLLQLALWLLFLALALPLALIAWSARTASQSLPGETIDEPKTLFEGPLEHDEDGTLSQTFIVQMPKRESVTVTLVARPIAISAHGRPWAANAVLLGLLLVFVGMLGLFHFPSSFGSSNIGEAVNPMEDNKP